MKYSTMVATIFYIRFNKYSIFFIKPVFVRIRILKTIVQWLPNILASGFLNIFFLISASFELKILKLKFLSFPTNFPLSATNIFVAISPQLVNLHKLTRIVRQAAFFVIFPSFLCLNLHILTAVVVSSHRTPLHLQALVHFTASSTTECVSTSFQTAFNVLSLLQLPTIFAHLPAQPSSPALIH